MARIAGVNLPKGKRIEVALTYIYGIGRSASRKILAELKINLDTKVEDLKPEQEQKIREAIGKLATEGDLRRQVGDNIKRLQEIGTYRGFRHRRHLPVRGQRTKTNARTKRGKRKTMGSGKTKVEKK
ncbi:30S ribosomal protein S13 [Patescibacteria group bacterium]|nr:30S ribosomal protein S13 [Patescibacteria group bacterium]MBU1016450.1 30S ribosomal protein S13 [Patescibacteria group bacterium]MBU1684948.1 30S ribosomal protein S13 [Patescibacteria group bacterium]MBU1939024.1 30S ribosomal protein S13 [Patescibacteria group bacterium]